MHKNKIVKKSVIFSSGAIKEYQFCKNIAESADLIICADGGMNHTFELGIIPDIILGDLDSANQECIEYYKGKNVKFVEFLSDKDKTDTQICLEYALEVSDEVVILGGMGGRLDHTIANISLLKLALSKGKKTCLMNEKNTVYMLDSKLKLSGKRGELISLIPISERVEGLCVKGAHYELQSAVMEIGNPYGVSNYFVSEEVEIKISSGYLLAIKSQD